MEIVIFAEQFRNGSWDVWEHICSPKEVEAVVDSARVRARVRSRMGGQFTTTSLRARAAYLTLSAARRCPERWGYAGLLRLRRQGRGRGIREDSSSILRGCGDPGVRRGRAEKPPDRASTDSIFGVAVNRRYTLQWLLPQEKATLYSHLSHLRVFRICTSPGASRYN